MVSRQDCFMTKGKRVLFGVIGVKLECVACRNSADVLNLL